MIIRKALQMHIKKDRCLELNYSFVMKINKINSDKPNSSNVLMNR